MTLIEATTHVCHYTAFSDKSYEILESDKSEIREALIKRAVKNRHCLNGGPGGGVYHSSFTLAQIYQGLKSLGNGLCTLTN